MVFIIAGINSSAHIKQENIETTTKSPKNRNGAKFENIRAEKPIITDMALKTIPRPVVLKVFAIAVSIFFDIAYSLLYRHKKCMV